MKVVAFNGSPRKNGNTAFSLKVVLNELEQAGIDTELVQVGGHTLAGCRACGGCKKNGGHCVLPDDGMNGYIDKMREADGILVGSPVYFANINTETKALIDRAGSALGQTLAGKVGAPVVAARRAGGTFAYAAINFFFGIKQMIVPGSTYWNLTLARDIGDAQKDEEGVRTFENLGKNMAALLKALEK